MIIIAMLTIDIDEYMMSVIIMILLIKLMATKLPTRQ